MSKTKKYIFFILLFFVFIAASAVIFDRVLNKEEKNVSEQKNVGEMQCEEVPVWMQFAFFPANYAQVSEGDYYYLRGGRENTYTIFKNKGEEIATFTLCKKGENCYITGFAKYKEKFYLMVEDYDSLQVNLEYFDITEKKLVTLKKDMPLLGFDNLDYFRNYYLYKDHLFARNVNEEISVIPLSGNTNPTYHTIHFEDENYNKLFNSDTDEVKKILGKSYFTYQDGEMYFGFQTDKKVSLFKINCKLLLNPYDNWLVMKEFASYNADSREKTDIVITFDENYMYSQNWAISRKNGEKRKFAKGVVKAVSTTSAYIFYIDDAYRIHRVDKKDFKDRIISGIKALGIDCVDNGIYVREYNDILRRVSRKLEFPKEWESGNLEYYRYSNAIYFMDFNGENVETVEEADTDYLEHEDNKSTEPAVKDSNVVNRTGEKLADVLKEVDLTKQGISTNRQNMASVYNGNVQLDGHFYYITCDNREDVDDAYIDEKNVTYTVYRDKGERVKQFTTKGELESFVYYHNKFYMTKSYSNDVALNMTSDFQRLENDGHCTNLAKYTYNINDITKKGIGNNFIMEGDKVYRCEIKDSSMNLVQVKENGSEKILAQIEGIQRGSYDLDFMVADGKLFYAIQNKKKMSLYYIDLVTGEKVKFYVYTKEGGRENQLMPMSLDNDFIYCDADIISIKTGAVSSYDVKEEGMFAATEQYVFYVDRENRLHRIDKKTDADKNISKIKIKKVNATEEGLFVEKYDKELEEEIEADNEFMWFHYYPTNLYYMDFNGTGWKRIA